MPPIRFAFGLHLHQPVGNFDQVFAQHVEDVYRPLLNALADREFLPVVLHLSGPLLDWLEQHEPAYLDRLGRLAADGKVELLLAGYYEPVLASLPRPDRVEQIRWMHEAVRRRFGVDARGLWLTERVWEPELAADLADAGVRYALVDDRHFLVTGFAPHQLHAPFWTESDGKRVALFPIDERLRYLVPFRPPEESAAYLRELRSAGHGLALLADDGEKFGGWPGTKEWVYGKGWLDRFMAAIGGLIDQGEVVLSRLDDALEAVPSGGLAYLPTASYREMEAWSLPPDGAIRLARLETDLGPERVAGPDGALIRGAHWRNFLVKYPESNRMHKKMMALSALARRAGDPPAVRRAIGRAQCNDAYWHGVFGGLYLPHLRDAIWRNLAEAEAGLRRDEGLAWDVLDIDADGYEEIWVHAPGFALLVSPARGGAIEEYTVFATGINYANALTRRREAYHELAQAAELASDGEPELGLDHDDRALFVDRVLPGGLRLEDYVRGAYRPVRSWARHRFAWAVERRNGGVEIVCSLPDGSTELEKRVWCDAEGRVTVSWRWEQSAGEPGDCFATELSVAGAVALVATPAAEEWRFEIETVAKSERGLDRTRQGESITLRWPIALGGARVQLEPARS
ncbi:MAG TPA: alpha-amylase/4-alpha-glucanotransferase domain-containing protein [Gemmatimonadales bacterium]|nr:alpha-amylase/4-alpha-glucanotransferase domain-containing protein [Gemmatimonadales bacterium]